MVNPALSTATLCALVSLQEHAPSTLRVFSPYASEIPGTVVVPCVSGLAGTVAGMVVPVEAWGQMGHIVQELALQGPAGDSGYPVGNDELDAVWEYGAVACLRDMGLSVVYSWDLIVSRTVLDLTALDRIVLNLAALDQIVLNLAVLDRIVLDLAVLDRIALDLAVLDLKPH